MRSAIIDMFCFNFGSCKNCFDFVLKKAYHVVFKYKISIRGPLCLYFRNLEAAVACACIKNKSRIVGR